MEEILIRVGPPGQEAGCRLVCLTRQQAAAEIEAYRREHSVWEQDADDDKLYRTNTCRRPGRWYFEFDAGFAGPLRGGPFLSREEAEEEATDYHRLACRSDPPRYGRPPRRDQGEEEIERDSNEPVEDEAMVAFVAMLEAMLREGRSLVVHEGGEIRMRERLEEHDESVIHDICVRLTGIHCQTDEMSVQTLGLSPRDQRWLVLAVEGEQPDDVVGATEINAVREAILDHGKQYGQAISDEWVAARHPVRMLECVRHVIGQRKLRLLAVASCRRVWSHMPDERVQTAVAVAEASADGSADDKMRGDAEQSVQGVLDSLNEDSPGGVAVRYAAQAVLAALGITADLDASPAEQASRYSADAAEADAYSRDPDGDYATVRQGEEESQAALFRDILGNPFRQAAFDPAWRTSTVVAMAGQMYDSRDFSAMPILADALQDAGCDNAAILDHCRDLNQIHVRGCWVVDLVLKQE